MSDPERSPYDVLHVARDASPHEIKLAYRACAWEAHPDQGKSGSDAKMQELNDAHDILKDADKRALWDLEHPQTAQFGGGSSDMEAQFLRAFGQRPRPRTPPPTPSPTSAPHPPTSAAPFRAPSTPGGPDGASYTHLVKLCDATRTFLRQRTGAPSHLAHISLTPTTSDPSTAGHVYARFRMVEGGKLTLDKGLADLMDQTLTDGETDDPARFALGMMAVLHEIVHSLGDMRDERLAAIHADTHRNVGWVFLTEAMTQLATEYYVRDWLAEVGISSLILAAASNYHQYPGYTPISYAVVDVISRAVGEPIEAVIASYLKEGGGTKGMTALLTRVCGPTRGIKAAQELSRVCGEASRALQVEGDPDRCKEMGASFAAKVTQILGTYLVPHTTKGHSL